MTTDRTHELAAQVAAGAKETLRWKRRANRMLAAIIAISVVAVALISVGAYRELIGVRSEASQTNHELDLLRANQIATCEASKSPGGVRFIVADGIRQELEQAKGLDYHKLFPNIPPEQLDTLLQAQRERQRAQIHDLLGVDCRAIYPQITSP